jgi:tRNA (cytidine/uridine-2'-O-)-methyltransferase
MPLTLALYQPDIPQNAGTMMRLCACLGVSAAIVGPAAFPISDRAFRRAGLDYLDRLVIERHDGFAAFERWRARAGRRLVLLTTAGTTPYCDAAFGPEDVLMVGRESAGVPDLVRKTADLSVVVPMQPGLRSLNVAAAAMVLGEALRQTGTFPPLASAGR